MPTDRAARERLRDQQRQEVARLAGVLAAQRQLMAEQRRAGERIQQARRKVAERQATVDSKVIELVDTSGTSRAAILLDRPEPDLVRLQRSRRARERSATPDVGAGGNGDPGVPA